MFKYSSQFYFDKGLKIAVDIDILRYYLWHIYRSPHDCLGQMLPKYRGHISVTLPKFHGDAVEKSEKYSGQSVDFWYDTDMVVGGSWFKNFWMKVKCPRADEIKKELGIIEDNSLGFHLTIASSKAFIIQQNPKARELSERANKGEFSNDEFREKMKQL